MDYLFVVVHARHRVVRAHSRVDSRVPCAVVRVVPCVVRALFSMWSCADSRVVHSGRALFHAPSTRCWRASSHCLCAIMRVALAVVACGCASFAPHSHLCPRVVALRSRAIVTLARCRTRYFACCRVLFVRVVTRHLQMVTHVVVHAVRVLLHACRVHSSRVMCLSSRCSRVVRAWY
jgi:hypothetical protein